MNTTTDPHAPVDVAVCAILAAAPRAVDVLVFLDARPYIATRRRIVGTDHYTYDAWEPAPTHFSHSTMHRFPGLSLPGETHPAGLCGKVGTRSLPADVLATPTDARRGAAARTFRAACSRRAFRVIARAFPEARASLAVAGLLDAEGPLPLCTHPRAVPGDERARYAFTAAGSLSIHAPAPAVTATAAATATATGASSNPNA